MESDNTVINVRGLTKRYENQLAVDHIDMQVARGCIHGFLGPNGSGKTTTIRMLCGLLIPDEGSGSCLGYDLLTQSRQIKRQVGYMTQKFGLYEDLSIRENLDFIARVYQVEHRNEKVTQTLEQLGLTARASQLAGALSGGWKQRLALAACLLHQPKLLLLDEPTAGVDPNARRTFWDQLHTLAANGMTILVSTHYMDEAERCHQLAYIAYGKLLAQGTAAELIQRQGLTTWAITGPQIHVIAQALRLRGDPVLNVASFGATLHVSATSTDALEKSLAPFRTTDMHIAPIATSLEDVFITLMRQAEITA